MCVHNHSHFPPAAYFDHIFPSGKINIVCIGDAFAPFKLPLLPNERELCIVMEFADGGDLAGAASSCEGYTLKLTLLVFVFGGGPW